METGNENTKIRAADLSEIKKDLLDNKAPLPLDELTKKLAFKEISNRLKLRSFMVVPAVRKLLGISIRSGGFVVSLHVQ